MGLLECASGASVWRGYDYYKGNKVLKLEKVEADVYRAVVTGKAKLPYEVELNIRHPRKSKCNCPHADGKRIVCKHIVAAYFTLFPDLADEFYSEAMAYQEEEEQRHEEQLDRVVRHVEKMKKKELQQELLRLLLDGPEWQYDRFIRENDRYEEWQ